MTDVSQETDGFTPNIAAQIEQKRAGRRKLVRHGGTLCSGCYAQAPEPGQRYCKTCRNTDRRARRKAERAELKRLRDLEKQMSEGIDNEH